MLDFEYHVYIWQLSCSDICQTWTRFKESKGYFHKIENFAYGELTNRTLVTPTPGHKIAKM